MKASKQVENYEICLGVKLENGTPIFQIFTRLDMHSEEY